MSCHAPRHLLLKPEDFSRDPAWIDVLAADPLIHHEVQPLETVAALARAGEQVHDGLALLSRPLFLHGTADRAAKPMGSQLLHDAAASTDKVIKFYDGHYHELLNDLERGRVTNDIGNWIGKRTRPYLPDLKVTPFADRPVTVQLG